MTEHLVIAGNVGGVPDFSKALGYLDCLVDEEVLIDVRAYEVPQDSDLELLFPGDNGVREKLNEMNLPESYVVFRARVLDKPEASAGANQFSKRFRTQYRFYEAE